MNQIIPQKDGMAGWKVCEKSSCKAPLAALVLGGVGKWANTIMCSECMHIRRGVPLAVLHSLVSEKYGITQEEARMAFERAQAQYEAALVDEHSRYYIPITYGGGLPLIERWRLAYQRGEAP